MWYKRYGYKKPPSGALGIGCFGASIVSAIAFALAFLPAYIFNNAFFLLLFFPIGVLLLHFSNQYLEQEGDRRRNKRFSMHLESAQKSIRNNRVEEALESLRKAKIYGELPQELIEYWNENT